MILESALKYIESRRTKRSLKQFKETLIRKGHSFNVHQKYIILLEQTGKDNNKFYY